MEIRIFGHRFGNYYDSHGIQLPRPRRPRGVAFTNGNHGCLAADQWFPRECLPFALLFLSKSPKIQPQMLPPEKTQRLAPCPQRQPKNSSMRHPEAVGYTIVRGLLKLASNMLYRCIMCKKQGKSVMWGNIRDQKNVLLTDAIH